MTINYTNLLGLAKPVTGTETGQWGDVVNDQITELVEDAVANSSSISVTSGDVTLTTTTGSANQARMSTLIITGSPGVTRNIIAPSQAKTYVVINQSNASVVIKGSATTGVTVGTNQTAQVAWNGSDFVEIGNYVHGNFVVNGNLSVNGDSTLGDGGADTSTVNGLLVAANSNISKAAALTTSAPAFAWIKGATYTDTASSGTIAHAPFNLITAPTLSTSNVTTYTNASTLYISGAPSAAGSATITNAAALFIAGGGANITGSVRSQAAATQDALVIAGRSGGTSSYATTLTPGTLTASNTLTLPIGTTTLAGLGTTQTFSAAQTFSGAVTMSAATNTISIGTSQTTGVTIIGGTAQTGTLTFGRSTGAQTLEIGVGATTSGTTKTINFGTAGVSGSTTNLNYGSAVSGATVTHTWSSGANSMTLDSSGNLGIGTTSPTAALDISKASFIGGPLIGARFNTSNLRMGIGIGNTNGFPFLGVNVNNAANDNGTFDISNWASRIRLDNGVFQVQTSSASGTAGNAITWNTPLYLDSSGNLGLGATLSAWNGMRALQINDYGSAIAAWNSNRNTYILSNAYYDAAFKFSTTATASAVYYNASGETGVHSWHTAGSPASRTAGNAITFTQAMTLDASGNLLNGLTTASFNGTDQGLQISRSSVPAALRITKSTSNFDIANDGAGVYMFLRDSNSIIFGTNNTERARITSGGNLLVGTTNNYSRLTVSNGSSTRSGITISDGNTASFMLFAGASADAVIAVDTNNIVFKTGATVGQDNGTERARITSGGDLLVGTTTAGAGIGFDVKLAVDAGSGETSVFKTSSSGAYPSRMWNSATTGDNAFSGFLTEGGSGTLRGSITYNRAGGLVAYNTTSDYRAKDIIGPVQNPGATIDALKVYEGKMKGATQSRPMLVAHEAQDHAPYAVTGEKDAVNEDGTPKYQQMDVSSLVPLLLAEIQSLRVRVAQLESKGV